MKIFDGMLTKRNAAEVTKLLEQALRGKKYAFVAANEISGLIPQVHTDVMLCEDSGGSPVSLNTDSPKAGTTTIYVRDYHSSWHVSTEAEEATGSADDRYPWITIYDDKIVICHRAPAGHKLVWVIAFQQ